MTMKTRQSILAALLIGSTAADAAIVSNTNISLTDGRPYFADYELTVFQDEAATDPTSMWFNASGPTLSLVTVNIDESSDWYLTALGDQFSHDTIQRSDFPKLGRSPLAVGFGDFYLGVNTGRGFVSPGYPNRNLYGWVHLHNEGGTITMLGNAMSYEGGGIVIGTTAVIPEPEVSRLLVVGLAAVCTSAGGLARRTEPSAGGNGG